MNHAPQSSAEPLAATRINSYDSKKGRRQLAFALLITLTLFGSIVACNYSDWLQSKFSELALLSTFQVNPESAEPSQDANDERTIVSTLVLKSSERTVLPRVFTGTIKPRRTSQLGFKGLGRVEKVAVEHGELVKRDQLLAQLESRKIAAEIAVLENKLAAATAQLKELKAGPRVQTIAATVAHLNEAEAMLRLAQATADRLKGIENSGAISRQDFDDARLQLAAAEARVESRRQELAEIKAGTRSEQIEAQQAVIGEIQSAIASLQVDLGDTQLLAPYDAIVDRRMVNEGTIVSPGVEMFRIMEVGHPQAWIGVPLDIAGRLNETEAYQFQIGDQKLQGRLKSVLPEVDSVSRTKMTIFEFLDESHDSFRGTRTFGQIVQLKLDLESTQAGFWVPLTSISRGEQGLWAVYVLGPPTDVMDPKAWVVQRREVEVIQVEANRVLIKGLVMEGEQLVSAGVQKLVPGQIVWLNQSR